jgi:REP element-mobilizing transposase RayT
MAGAADVDRGKRSYQPRQALMRNESDALKRRATRMPGYDYSRPGAYFVTISVQGRLCLLGAVSGDVSRLNPAGEMVARWWRELPRKFAGVEVDADVVMPNHVHAIIVINGCEGALPSGTAVGADLCVRPVPRPNTTSERSGDQHRTSLSNVIQWFKTMTTNAYIRGVKELGWPPFDGRLWQRTFYDHVIRNEAELNRIKQ